MVCKSSEIDMMQVSIAGFSRHSGLALDLFENENNIDLGVVSESQDSVSRFQNYELYRSRAEITVAL